MSTLPAVLKRSATLGKTEAIPGTGTPAALPAGVIPSGRAVK